MPSKMLKCSIYFSVNICSPSWNLTMISTSSFMCPPSFVPDNGVCPSVIMNAYMSVCGVRLLSFAAAFHSGVASAWRFADNVQNDW